MGYLVKARVNYKSGNYVVQAFTPDEVTIGSIYECLVPSGYTTTCMITEILAQNVATLKGKVTVITIAKNQSNQPKIKEEVTMTNKLFITVFVENRKGFQFKCHSLVMYNPGEEVVYEGSDGELHVGKVVETFLPNVAYETHKRQYNNGGYIAHSVTREQINVCSQRQAAYDDTLQKLQARKKAMEERAIWDLLAEKDPDAKKLLEELDALTGNK
jgi:hypothetical protein